MFQLSPLKCPPKFASILDRLSGQKCKFESWENRPINRDTGLTEDR